MSVYSPVHPEPKPVGPFTISADILAAPMLRAVALSGLSRSGIYRAAAEGRIRLVKAGRTTLVDMASVRSFIASLPAAQIGASKRGA